MISRASLLPQIGGEQAAEEALDGISTAGGTNKHCQPQLIIPRYYRPTDGKEKNMSSSSKAARQCSRRSLKPTQRLLSV